MSSKPPCPPLALSVPSSEFVRPAPRTFSCTITWAKSTALSVPGVSAAAERALFQTPSPMLRAKLASKSAHKRLSVKLSLRMAAPAALRFKMAKNFPPTWSPPASTRISRSKNFSNLLNSPTIFSKAFGDNVINTIAEYAPNIRDVIIERQVLTPLDLEREFGLTQGNIFQGELSLEQLFFLRPVAGWAYYRTPVHNLYMCGSETHTRGGIMGANGRIASQVILKEWKSYPVSRMRPARAIPRPPETKPASESPSASAVSESPAEKSN